MGSKPKSSAQQFDSHKPKSPELQALESRMYGAVMPLINAYTMPLTGSGGGGGVAPGIPGAPGMRSGGDTGGNTEGPAYGTPGNPIIRDLGIKGAKFMYYGDPNNPEAQRLHSRYDDDPIPDGAYIENRVWRERGKNGGGRWVMERTPVKYGDGGAPAQQQAQATQSMAGPYNFIGPDGIPQPYDNNTLMGQLFNDATKKTYLANRRYDSLLDRAPWYTQQSDAALGEANRLLGLGSSTVGQAHTEGDWWYDQAKGAYGKADRLIDESAANIEYGRGVNKWYDDYTREMLGGAKQMLDTGTVPQPILDAMVEAMRGGVDKTLGANVNDLASRGVINSSVMNRGISDMAGAISDSMNKNYLDTFNSILGGYNNTAGTAANAGRAFADSTLNISNALSNAARSAVDLGTGYGTTGHSRVTDLLNVAKGYNDSAAGYGTLSKGYLDALDANVKERDSLVKHIPQYYVNAAAPMLPAYDFMKTMQQDRWNGDQVNTVINQGGGGPGCFVTTAVCEFLGKPDDCHELTTLRRFRDDWLKKQPDGEKLVQMYYDIAPRVVEKLDKSPNRGELYRNLYETHIKPCVTYIEAGENEKCKELYTSMIRRLYKDNGGDA